MANLSSAFGTVTIQAETPELIKQLLQLHEAAEKHVYYETDIEYDETQLESEIEPYEDKYLFETIFTATGRWSFSSNVDWFFSLLTGGYDKELEKHGLIDLKNEVKNHDFSVTFSFTDSEPGCAFIDIGTAITEWIASKQKAHTSYNVTESLDYTVENLLEHDIYGKGDIVSVQYILDNYDEVMENEDPIYMQHKDKFVELFETLSYKESICYDMDELLSEYPEIEQLVNSLKGN